MQISVRVSIWRANGQRCLYCGDSIAFRDLEIDHVIPNSTSDAELAKVVAKLGLGADFSVNDIRNLVPTHHDCNRKKLAIQFNEANLRYYLGLWEEKQGRIKEEVLKFERVAERDDILARVTHQVEIGSISKSEVIGLLESLESPQESTEQYPMVLSFGMLCGDLHTADAAEKKLIEKLRNAFRRPLIPAEPSQFTGETLSVRLAIWNLDIDKIESLSLGGWELLEVDAASRIYDNDSARLLGEALNDTYNVFYAERHGCPACGGEIVISGSDSESGELVIATCKKCGWEDYHA